MRAAISRPCWRRTRRIDSTAYPSARISSMNARIKRLRGSSSPAKKIEARRRISLSSRSRLTSPFRRLTSADSSLVTPGLGPVVDLGLGQPAPHGLPRDTFLASDRWPSPRSGWSTPAGAPARAARTSRAAGDRSSSACCPSSRTQTAAASNRLFPVRGDGERRVVDVERLVDSAVMGVVKTSESQRTTSLCTRVLVRSVMLRARSSTCPITASSMPSTCPTGAGGW